jgi:hypothetical protein
MEKSKADPPFDGIRAEGQSGGQLSECVQVKQFTNTKRKVHGFIMHVIYLFVNIKH